MWNSLTENHNVITLDMIGFGYSAKPRTYDYNMLDQADLIQALLSKLGINKINILAHDYGDTVAQELLHRQNQILYIKVCLSSHCNRSIFSL